MTHEPFQVEHFDALELQPAQAYLRALATPEYLQRFREAGPCFTVRDNGRILVIAGLIEMPEFSHFWSFVSVHARAHMLTLTRYGLRFLQAYRRTTYTATVEVGFEAGCRWLRILGFMPEDLLPGFGPDGRDHQRYVRGVL